MDASRVVLEARGLKGMLSNLAAGEAAEAVAKARTLRAEQVWARECVSWTSKTGSSKRERKTVIRLTVWRAPKKFKRTICERAVETSAGSVSISMSFGPLVS